MFLIRVRIFAHEWTPHSATWLFVFSVSAYTTRTLRLQRPIFRGREESSNLLVLRVFSAF